MSEELSGVKRAYTEWLGDFVDAYFETPIEAHGHAAESSALGRTLAATVAPKPDAEMSDRRWTGGDAIIASVALDAKRISMLVHAAVNAVDEVAGFFGAECLPQSAALNSAMLFCGQAQGIADELGEACDRASMTRFTRWITFDPEKFVRLCALLDRAANRAGVHDAAWRYFEPGRMVVKLVEELLSGDPEEVVQQLAAALAPGAGKLALVKVTDAPHPENGGGKARPSHARRAKGGKVATARRT